MRDRLRTGLARYMPGVSTLASYRLRWLPRDLFSAFTVSAMLIAQGMAFAYLIGLPPGVGIWTSIASLLGYAVFGPSRQLMVGPEAGTAILMVAVAAPFGLSGTPEQAALTAFAAAAMALLLAIGGLLRLGVLADFLSQPILIGYLNGMAFIVVASQLGDTTGIEVEAQGFFPQVAAFMRNIEEIHWPTALLSLGTVALVMGFRFLAPRIPGTAVAVVLALALSALLEWEDRFELVGTLPSSLPSLALPPLPDLSSLLRLSPGVFALTFLGYASAVLTSRAFADKNRYKVDANQEFFGLAAANFLAGLVGGYPVAASESRTAVADFSGSKTQAVSIFAAVILLLATLILGPVIALLPRAVLGAVVVTAGLFLIDLRSFLTLARSRPSECAIAVLTVLGVLIFGILNGILIAVGLATLDLVRHAARPHDAVLGRIQGKPGYHGIDTEAPSSIVPGLLIYRVDGPLFFANARFVRERVREILDAQREPARLVVLDAGAVFDIDFTAARALHELHADLERRGSDLAIAEPHEPIRKVLRRTGLFRAIGHENIFPTVGAAIDAFLERESEDEKRVRWTRTKEEDLPPEGPAGF